MNEEIKKVIDFPVRYDNYGTSIFDESNNQILDIRGWGRLQYSDNAEELQDSIGKFVADAINKHAEKDEGVQKLQEERDIMCGSLNVCAEVNEQLKAKNKKLTDAIEAYLNSKGPSPGSAYLLIENLKQALKEND